MQKNEPQLHIREWRKARNLTQQDLADQIGRDKSIVSKLERNVSGITSATLNGIAAALGVTPAALYEPPPEGTRPKSADTPHQAGSVAIEATRTRADGMVTENLVGDRLDLPVYASAQGGQTGMVISYEPIDWVKRPEPLFNVKNGFGMYVVGDSMFPAYRQGDMILIHPSKPANPGDDVLVVKKNGSTQEFEALVKTLISTNSKEIRLAQYNPSDEFSIPKDTIQAVYLIVAKYHKR